MTGIAQPALAAVSPAMDFMSMRLVSTQRGAARAAPL